MLLLFNCFFVTFRQTPAEQAKVRMQMVLQAAAKTDEVLKAKVAKREEEAQKKLEDEGTSLEEQVRRIKDIEAIESDSFVPQAFKSSRDDIKRQPRPNQKVLCSAVLFQPETVSSDAPLFAGSNAAAPTQKPQQAAAVLRPPPPTLVVQMQTKHRGHY
ncbi:serine/Arginine-related protein 53 isoform X1 [Austrofundulus limnaeus]|uniref:Serine/Arginine-related protein 53 isoform X1 n=1 Tax=Austrofundulus limnaeus TaxID=52670 RepID=A0A2I4AYZ3_AUSLI|nr:PREDICTED: serine/Arginine-related protein 53-like isoform X1 [Austrofundulus limnaeus]